MINQLLSFCTTKTTPPQHHRRIMQYQFVSEDVARGPPAASVPLKIFFSPRGHRVTFLAPDVDGKHQIFSFNPSDNQKRLFFKFTSARKELSMHEQMMRERLRQFTSGITDYEWVTCSAMKSSSHDFIVIPLSGQIWLLECNRDDDSCQLFNLYDGSQGDAIDAQISPNGLKVAFCINNDIYVKNISKSADEISEPPTRLTALGGNGVLCGVADYLAQEEMHRFRGYWWSPDSETILFTLVDETVIPEFIIHHLGSDDPHMVEKHRYPFAGATNPIYKLGTVGVSSSSSSASTSSTGSKDGGGRAYASVTMLELPGKELQEGGYIARADWWPDNTIMCQIQNRRQNELTLLKIDPASGESIVVLKETSGSWVNLHEIWKCFRITDFTYESEKDFHFIWASERTGFQRIYSYLFSSSANAVSIQLDGLPVGEVESHETLSASDSVFRAGGSKDSHNLKFSDWSVDSLDAVDEKLGLIYFSGNSPESLERKHLYVAKLTVQEAKKKLIDESKDGVSNQEGYHRAIINTSSNLLVDVFSSTRDPPSVKLYRINTDTLALEFLSTIYDASKEGNFQRYLDMADSLVHPTISSVECTDENDGSNFNLNYALFLPKGYKKEEKSEPLPLVVQVYGGPHVQRVSDQWMTTTNMRAQLMVQKGFAVVMIDNRGSSRRGLAFESALNEDMGNVEVKDQAFVVRNLIDKGIVDAARIGIMGWSYGGYMSLMCLFQEADLFRCAVSGAPVTSWDGYDTHYTERYMNTPQANERGYKSSSVMTYAHQMKGQLMLVHGLIDENVHFRHTSRLINSLIELRKDYKLLLFPHERHSPRLLHDRIFMEDQMTSFFMKELLKPVSALSHL